MKKIDLSIIILSYNTKDLLRDCLKTVFAAVKIASGKEIEVIVVDNASKDGSAQMVRKEFPRVILLVNKKNLGYAKGNNLGLRKAQGRLVLFLNSDTQIKPESLEEIIKFMDEDTDIGATTPKTMLFSGKMDPDCHRGFPTPWASFCYFTGLEKVFPKSRIFGRYHKFYLDLDKIHEIDAGFGTFMIVRKEVLEKVGYWDESYFFYGEDLDLFYRIKQAGFKVMFYPLPLLVHYKGGSSGLRRESGRSQLVDRKIRLRTARASIEGMEIFYKKFYQNIYPTWLTSLVIWGIKIKGFTRVAYHFFKK